MQSARYESKSTGTISAVDVLFFFLLLLFLIVVCVCLLYTSQIIQELESAFRGAGWNVVKVLWGTEWDPILERDTEGLLVKRMGCLLYTSRCV